MKIEMLLKSLFVCLFASSMTVCNAEFNDSCSIGSLPDVKFQAGSIKISNSAKQTLDTVFVELQRHPSCKVNMVTKSRRGTLYFGWDRLNAVILYLVGKGIDKLRLEYSVSEEQDVNTISFQAIKRTVDSN